MRRVSLSDCHVTFMKVMIWVFFFKQKYWESHKMQYLKYIAVTAVQYPSLSLYNTLCRILLNFWQNWWKQFDIQSLQLLKLSNLFNLLHLRQFRLLTQSPLVEALINPNLNLFVIREGIWCQFGWTAFGGRLQQSGHWIEKYSNKSGNPISKPNIGPVGVLLASKRAHSSKNFFAGQKFQFLYLKPIKGSPADETV